MILIITPDKTWNPWKPVIKKKKLANNVFPYSLACKLAPITTVFASFKKPKASWCGTMIFVFNSGLICSVLMEIAGFALKLSTTSLRVKGAISASFIYHRPLFLVSCVLSECCDFTKLSKVICSPVASTN